MCCISFSARFLLIELILFLHIKHNFWHLSPDFCYWSFFFALDLPKAAQSTLLSYACWWCREKGINILRQYRFSRRLRSHRMKLWYGCSIASFQLLLRSHFNLKTMSIHVLESAFSLELRPNIAAGYIPHQQYLTC